MTTTEAAEPESYWTENLDNAKQGLSILRDQLAKSKVAIRELEEQVKRANAEAEKERMRKDVLAARIAYAEARNRLDWLEKQP